MVKKICACIVFLCLFSCANKKDILYFQNIDAISKEVKSYEPTIKPDDLLMIFVSAENAQAAAPFNLPTFSSQSAVAGNLETASGQVRYQTYLVNNAGYIDFPVIGELKLAGLSKNEAHKLLKEKLTKYIDNPIVNLRIANFEITVMGEVAKPQTFPVVTERVTLPEALSQAGDLTIYGDRKNIIVIREVNGIRTYNTVDLTNVDFINSDFYYLTQNDVVYVSPNRVKVNSSAVGTNTSVIISSISLLLTVVALITR